jgi:CheY-like chemotaxis protein/two-component sensor histidine kinase
LLLSEDPRENQHHHLELLNYSSETLLHLINNILDFNKIESGKVELNRGRFAFRELITNVFESMKPIVEKKKEVDFRLKLDDNLPLWVVGDKGRLNQVLLNLLNNAIKFTANGQVSLEVEVTHQDDEGHLIHFVVNDSGIGIPEDRQHTVFEAFTQADSSVSLEYGGTGLGLPISRGVVRLMGGDLHLKSIEGQGSEFSFTLYFPLVENDQNVPLPPNQEKSSMTDLQGRKILLVEDNIINQKVTQRFLEKWGVNVDIAVNGQEALNMLVDPTYDLVLMDLQMPVMDGYTCVEHIRSHSDERVRNLPVISLTADNSDETLPTINSTGMNGYISKPFNPLDFADKLNEAIRRNSAE